MAEDSAQRVIEERIEEQADSEYGHERVGRLLAAARDGNDPAFEELMRLFRADVYRVALGIMAQPDVATDVSQEVFLRLYKHLGRLEPRGVRAWLRRVTVNHCYDLLRARKRTESVEEHLLPGCMQTSDKLSDPEVAHLLQQALDILTPRERAAVVLTCQLGLSSAEAGEAMGIRPATVRVLTFSARDRLKELLMPKNPDWSV
jgi:RNA polymerase sigma-70 factor, ECF subfamily